MRTYRTRSWRAHRPAEASLVATVDTGGNGTTRVLGLDPGSRHTGYGIVDFTGPAATHIASGAIDTTAEEFSQRLQQIFAQVHELIELNNQFHSGDPLALSIGTAVSEPGERLEAALHRADKLMYAQKKAFHATAENDRRQP